MEKETKIVNLDKLVQSVSAQQGKAKGSILKNIGLFSAGAASGGLFLGLTGKAEESVIEPGHIPHTVLESSVISPESYISDLKIATSVTTYMDFGKAFATARAEVGAGGYFIYKGGWYGTYLANEWTDMTQDEKRSFSEAIYHHPNHEYFAGGSDSGVTAIVIHDVAPVATWVNDEMPIADAHVIARLEVGAGGIFVHEGKTYSTYYPSELAQMNSQQYQLFIDSVDKANISTEINDSGIELGETAIVEIDTTNLIYDTPDLQAPVKGEIIEEGFLDLGDGMVVYGQTIDTDNNGKPDVLRLTNPETNQKVEIIIDEVTGEIKIDEATGEPVMRFVDDHLSHNDFDDHSSHSDVYDYSSHIDFDPEADVTPWTET